MPTIMKWDGGQIEFDAVEVEEMTHDAVVTEYPVETGAMLVDHVRVLPLTLKLSAIVTNDPAREKGTKQSVPHWSHMDGLDPRRGAEIKILMPLIPGPPSAQLPTSIAGLQLTRETKVRAQVRVWGDGTVAVRRVTNVYAELLNAQAEARLFSVLSEVGRWDAMIIRSVHARREGALGLRTLRFDIEMRKLVTAFMSERDVSDLLAKPVEPTKEKSKPPKDAGKQQPEPIRPKDELHKRTTVITREVK